MIKALSLIIVHYCKTLALCRKLENILQLPEHGRGRGWERIWDIYRNPQTAQSANFNYRNTNIQESKRIHSYAQTWKFYLKKTNTSHTAVSVKICSRDNLIQLQLKNKKPLSSEKQGALGKFFWYNASQNSILVNWTRKLT